MATYTFVCPYGCTEALSRPIAVGPPRVLDCMLHANTEMRRDYRSDSPGLTGMVRLKQDRENGNTDHLFLPTNDDYKSPSDPDGTKGIREWRDNHQPKTENKSPRWPGSVERSTF